MKLCVLVGLMGFRRSVDDVSYTIRFTPRRRGSIWSAVNMKRVEELSKKGLMQPAGTEGVSGAERVQVGHLFLRTKER